MPTETIAAIDLGSNSFHMIVARMTEGQLQVIDRLREMVQLAAGLDSKQRLCLLLRLAVVLHRGAGAASRCRCPRSAPTVSSLNWRFPRTGWMATP